MEDWKIGAKPTARVEWFTNRPQGWNYGFVAVPIYASFSDSLKSNLNVKGTNFTFGSQAKISYQFHNFRMTANYTVYSSGLSFLRIGGSIIARYLNFKVESQGVSATNVNFIAFPILNLEGQLALTTDSSLHVRFDTFPTSNGVDGLYDLLIGYKVDRENGFTEAGLRAFWGGYSPNDSSDNNNRIVFVGPILRFGF